MPRSSSLRASAGASTSPAQPLSRARSARRSVGSRPLAITTLAAEPATISPNGDGAADTATITYTTTAPAAVTATMHDAAGVLRRHAPSSARGGRRAHAPFDGLGQPDGVYTLVLTAIDAARRSLTREVQITITRTLGSASLAPAVFTPNGDGSADELAVTFQLAAPATVRLRVLRDGKWVVTPFTGPLEAGPQTFTWNGAKRIGKALDGAYEAVIEATDAVGTSRSRCRSCSTRHPPVIKLLRAPGAALALRARDGDRQGQRLGAPARGARARISPARGINKVRSLVVVARDPAGNKAVLRRP